MKNKLEQWLREALTQADININDLFLEQPKQKSLGDYALTTAFQLAKSWKKAPIVIAKDLVSIFETYQPLNLAIEFSIVQGFINLKLKDDYLLSEFISFEMKQNKNKSKEPNFLLEFVSANPTGPLHIGHGRWAVIGDIYARVLRFMGKSVQCEFYINDAGEQIKHLIASVDAVKRNQAIPDSGYRGAYIQDLATVSQDPISQILDWQKQTLAKLNVNFDSWFSERFLHQSGLVSGCIDALTKKGHTYEKDGALWFKSSQFGDDKDRVLKKYDGAWTYFAVDIAYHHDKLKRGYKHLVNILGADHHGYVVRLKAAIKALTQLKSSGSGTIRVILGQLVSLFRNGEPVRMSKRTGDMVSLEEVIDEIGVDATRYFLAERSFNAHIDFDLTKAKEKNMANPVYYAQYAHARMSKLIERFNQEPEQLSSTLHPAERQLLVFMFRFEEIITNLVTSADIHQVVAYVNNLARCLHSIYEQCPMAGESLKTIAHRKYIINKATLFLKTLLEDILGITAPKSM